MPRYRCHKVVHALKIKDIIYHADADPAVSIEEFAKTPAFNGGTILAEEASFAPVAFDAEFYHKHNPEVGGYYVVYPDGYKSYSPAKAFEEGYSLDTDIVSPPLPQVGS